MQNYGGQPAASADPNAILNECREVDRALDDLDGQLANLERVFRQVLARPDMPSGEINNLSTQIMTGYRGLVSRVKNIKSKPESGSPRNAPQVGKVDRRLKATINKYQTLEADFRRDSQAAAERQYRIVRPDATEEEVREAVADPDAPIFQQAVRVQLPILRGNTTNRFRSSLTQTAAAKPRPPSATSRSATRPFRTSSARWSSWPSSSRISTRSCSSRSPSSPTSSRRAKRFTTTLSRPTPKSAAQSRRLAAGTARSGGACSSFCSSSSLSSSSLLLSHRSTRPPQTPKRLHPESGFAAYLCPPSVLPPSTAPPSYPPPTSPHPLVSLSLSQKAGQDTLYNTSIPGGYLNLVLLYLCCISFNFISCKGNLDYH